MDTLWNSIDSNPFDFREGSIEKSGFSIILSSENVCGTCGIDYSVSVTLGIVCKPELLSQIKEGNLDGMKKVLLCTSMRCSEGSGKVYRVVVRRYEEIRALVGKNRDDTRKLKFAKLFVGPSNSARQYLRPISVCCICQPSPGCNSVWPKRKYALITLIFMRVYGGVRYYCT